MTVFACHVCVSAWSRLGWRRIGRSSLGVQGPCIGYNYCMMIIDYLYFGPNVICQYILNICIHFWDVLVVLGCCLSDDVRRGCVILGQF